jgi:hypothetical protein
MASQIISLSERIARVQNSVQQLSSTSASLNSATDQLGKSVGELDAVLKKFSLGVPTWVHFRSEYNEDYYYHEDIGYAKIGGKWGVAIRTIEGTCDPDRNDDVEEWLFNDAPRLLRVQAVDRIPELLEALIENAAEMTQTITEKAKDVDALAAGINSVIGAPSRPAAGKR